MRDTITRFLFEVRQATLEAERQRGRPVLLAVRIPDCLVGCYFDGLDVPTWIRLNLADMIVLGVRSLDLEIEQIRHLVGDRPVQLIATLDDHHCSDGYSWPPIEVWRAAVCNWRSQGADAIQTFNWGVAPPALAERFGLKFRGAYDEGRPPDPDLPGGLPRTRRPRPAALQRQALHRPAARRRRRRRRRHRTVDDAATQLSEHQHARPAAGVVGSGRTG